MGEQRRTGRTGYLTSALQKKSGRKRKSSRYFLRLPLETANETGKRVVFWFEKYRKEEQE
jgi:hypothetical protein